MTDWLSLSPRTKSILLLGATLLLGLVLGAVLNAWWAQERFERLRRMRSPGGFEAMVVRAVDPTSEDQRRQVRRIAGRTAARIDTLRHRHRRELRTVVLQMRDELGPVLSDDQLRALTRRLQMSRRPGGRPGPPPFGPAAPADRDTSGG